MCAWCKSNLILQLFLNNIITKRFESNSLKNGVHSFVWLILRWTKKRVRERENLLNCAKRDRQISHYDICLSNQSNESLFYVTAKYMMTIYYVSHDVSCSWTIVWCEHLIMGCYYYVTFYIFLHYNFFFVCFFYCLLSHKLQKVQRILNS